MQIIYEPKGRALEYAPLAVNLYSGCSHGCGYCYAPHALRRPREVFREEISVRKEALEKLKKDAAKLKGDDREILMSFSTDPYQECELDYGITRKAIKILIKNDLRFTILTKGGMRAARDFDLLARYGKARFGSTIVFDREKSARKWEPNAPSLKDRIRAIEKAHSKGIPTWVSLEPVIRPKQALRLIEDLHPIVDHWKVGKVNGIKTDVDWLAFRKKVVRLLDSLGADYYVKESLRCL